MNTLAWVISPVIIIYNGNNVRAFTVGVVVCDIRIYRIVATSAVLCPVLPQTDN